MFLETWTPALRSSETIRGGRPKFRPRAGSDWYCAAVVHNPGSVACAGDVELRPSAAGPKKIPAPATAPPHAPPQQRPTFNAPHHRITTPTTNTSNMSDPLVLEPQTKYHPPNPPFTRLSNLPAQRESHPTHQLRPARARTLRRPMPAHRPLIPNPLPRRLLQQYHLPPSSPRLHLTGRRPLQHRTWRRLNLPRRPPR